MFTMETIWQNFAGSPLSWKVIKEYIMQEAYTYVAVYLSRKEREDIFIAMQVYAYISDIHMGKLEINEKTQ